MKLNLTLYLICFTIFISKAQNVKPYLAIVQTTEGKQKGILSFVDSNQLILKKDNSYIYIHYNDIKSIKLRVQKIPYQGKELVPYGGNTWIEDPYETLPNGQQVLKPGKEAPTLAESLAAPFVDILMTAFVNGVANGIMAPIHAINPSVANFTNSRKNPLTKEKILELRYYSTNYQINPDYIAEAQKLKEIAKNFRP